MRNRKTTYLLIILVFPILYGVKLIVDAMPRKIVNFTDLPGLIRNGYDLVDNDSIFPSLCTLLNDSLLEQKSSLRMAAFTGLRWEDNTINWDVWRYNADLRVFGMSDSLFFHIDLHKGGRIKAQGAPAQLSDIRSLARNYIFYPDSARREYIFMKDTIDQKGEIEVSCAGVCMKVYVKENNGFSVSDWQVFYNCMHELMALFEDERNKMSLRVWNKDYDSLSFQEQKEMVHLAGCRIKIEFE